jgi:hypothetical protein
MRLYLISSYQNNQGIPQVLFTPFLFTFHHIQPKTPIIRGIPTSILSNSLTTNLIPTGVSPYKKGTILCPTNSMSVTSLSKSQKLK